MNQRKKEEQRQLWIARLCDLEESAMTQEEWCKSKSISYSTFRYWFSKLKKEAETEDRETNWLKVDMSAGNEIATVQFPESEKSNTGCINVRFSDFTVELQNDCDPQRILEVLRILKSL